MLFKLLVLLSLAGASVSGFADCNGLDVYYAVIYSPGESWTKNADGTFADVWEQDLRAHGQYMTSLHSQGLMKLGGPMSGNSGGMAILKVASMEEAQRLIAVDPGVTSKLLKPDIKEWCVAFQ